MPEQVNKPVPRYHRRRRRRPRGRPVRLTLTLRVDRQAPARSPQGACSGVFAVQLARRLTGVHPDALEALALDHPQYRTDRLLELGAELGDALAPYAAGVVSESVVPTARWRWRPRRPACG